MMMKRTVLLAALGAGLGLVTAADAQNAGGKPVPDFSSMTNAWLAMGTDFKTVPGSPAIVDNDAAHPHVGNGGGRQSSFRFADLNNANLTDFAKQSLKKTNDEVLRGKAVFSREARCWPTGVPTYDLNQAQPVYFIQTPKEVWMIWQRDHMVRRVYMTDKHTANPKPQSFGESIGHYEGVTLVVDTIGLSTKNNFIDNWRTPHTEKEHAVERFTISPDGKTLTAVVMVEDPDTFNEPIHMKQTWHKVVNPLLETVCAENNNDAEFFHQKLPPIPIAAKADF